MYTVITSWVAIIAAVVASLSLLVAVLRTWV